METHTGLGLVTYLVEITNEFGGNGMITVKFTKEDINNLKIFLSRTSMTGAEVQAYINILEALKAGEEEAANAGR